MDTQGLALKIKVTAANLREQAGARQLLNPLGGQFPRMQLVWADQGYTPDLGDWMQEKLGWRLEIVKRSTQQEHHDKMRAIAKDRLKAGASVFEMWAGLPYGRGIKVPPHRGATSSLGGGAHLCLAGQVSAPFQGLRVLAGEQ